MSALLEEVRFKDASNWSVAHLMESQFNYNKEYELVRIGDFLIRNRNRITIEDHIEYRRVKIRMKNKGISVRDRVMGKEIGTKKQFLIKKGQFLLSKIDARNGAFGLATDEVDGAIITADFFAYEIDKKRIEPYFLVLLTTTKQFQKFSQGASRGTTGRQRIDEKSFLDVKIPLPSLEKQRAIVKAYQSKVDLAISQKDELNKKEKKIENFINEILGFEKVEKENTKLLEFINFKNMNIWGTKISNTQFKSFLYPSIKFGKIIKTISTGTTPSTSNREYFDGDINFYTPSDLGYTKDLFYSKRMVTEKALEDKKIRLFKKDTLLFVGIGSTTGKVGIVKNDRASSNQQITGIVMNDKLALVDFIYYYLNHLKDEIIKESYTSTIPIMNQEKIANIHIILPPLEIQREIVRYCQVLNNEIKGLEEKAEQNRALALSEFEEGIFSE